MRRAGSALAVLTLALAGASTASAHPLRVALMAFQTPRSQVVRVAHALTIQVNRDLRRFWPGPRVLVEPLWPNGHGAPGWTGGRTGAAWQVDVQSWGYVCVGVGIHTDLPRMGPQADVCRSHATDWTVTASHELLEMLEDPTGRIYDRGRLREVCDPVESRSYLIDGVRVSDFVTPAWFTRSPGVRDAMSAPSSG